jgi:hypothetical protein
MQDPYIHQWLEADRERQLEIIQEMNTAPMREDEAKGFKEHTERSWSQCCFCGATNGLYGTVLQEHTVRCRWIGPANLMETMHPNYAKKIDEDDVKLLHFLRIQNELLETKSKLAKLEKEHAGCAKPIEAEKPAEEEAKPAKKKR